MKPNKRQLQMLELCGFKFDNNKVIDIQNRNMLVEITYTYVTGMFGVKTEGKYFDFGDYDSVENFTIDVNHVLGLVYELNMLWSKNED